MNNKQKEFFIKTLNELLQYRERHFDLVKEIGLNPENKISTIIDWYELKLLESLALHAGDYSKDNWVSWWFYEAKSSPVAYINKNKYFIRTPVVLWNFILKWLKIGNKK